MGRALPPVHRWNTTLERWLVSRFPRAIARMSGLMSRAARLDARVFGTSNYQLAPRRPQPPPPGAPKRQLLLFWFRTRRRRIR